MEKAERKIGFKIEAIDLEKMVTSDEVTMLLVLFTVCLSLLDFYSHPNGGLADPERRKILMEVIGPMARHIGNFGFMAAAGISAVFMKNISNYLSENKIAQKITKAGFMTLIAMALACNALFEIMPKNPEGLKDLAFGVAGITSAIPAAELAIRKFKKARKEKKNKKSAIITP